MEFGAEEWRLGVLSLWIEEISAGILRDPPTQQVFTEQSPFSPPRGHKPTQVFSYTGGAPKPWVVVDLGNLWVPTSKGCCPLPRMA